MAVEHEPPRATSQKDEVGRELKADQLRAGTVVVLQREGRNLYATFWVQRVGSTSVLFYAKHAGIPFLLLAIKPDLTLADDTGTQIHVYEFLGEV